MSYNNRFRRAPPCGRLFTLAPNWGILLKKPLSSALHSMSRPMVMPNCAFMSYSSSWIIRSLCRYGFPGVFSIRSCIAVVQRGGGLVNFLAKFTMSRWNCSKVSSSSAAL
jgi:hypothetical protein